jgi:hypothetical protein
MADARMTRRAVVGAVGACSLWPVLGDALAIEAPAPAAAKAFEAVLWLGIAQAGDGNHRWAQVAMGEVTGGSLCGSVQSGRLDWHVDPATGAAEAVATCRVRGVDGKMRNLRHAKLAATRRDDGSVLLRAHPVA